jgi:lysophospholipase L1-like esterase
MKYLALFLLLFTPLFADPSKWQKDIAKFEAADEKSPPPKGAYLFIGSSSARMWDLKKSFPELKTINRGFGGSELEDSLFYADRILIPYQPKAVFLYAGDNDINKGKTAEIVTEDYQKFVAKVHKTLPKTDIVFLPIKPSLSRWNLWPKMNKSNQAIKALTEANPKLHYLDIPPAMLGSDGTPKKELFIKDGLHLSPEGYQLWSKFVKDWIAKQP